MFKSKANIAMNTESNFNFYDAGNENADNYLSNNPPTNYQNLAPVKEMSYNSVDYQNRNYQGYYQGQPQGQLGQYSQNGPQQSQSQNQPNQQSQNQIPTTQAQQPNYPQSNSKFSPQDVQMLKQLLLAGEKHKWKQITKEINYQAASRRGEVYSESSYPQADGSPSVATKNVSPTFVVKQYQALLGLPNNALHFGLLGSSLPYVTAPNGWDDLAEEST